MPLTASIEQFSTGSPGPRSTDQIDVENNKSLARAAPCRLTSFLVRPFGSLLDQAVDSLYCSSLAVLSSQWRPPSAMTARLAEMQSPSLPRKPVSMKDMLRRADGGAWRDAEDGVQLPRRDGFSTLRVRHLVVHC